MADTCLDEFTDHGHCGVSDADGPVDNDATNAAVRRDWLWRRQSRARTWSGPSGMMDGQVAAIRDGLDAAGHTDVGDPGLRRQVRIGVLRPVPRGGGLQLAAATGARTSRTRPTPARRCARSSSDIDEGADIVMVKPALGYLDVVRAAADISPVPVAAYQVSGEYAMVERCRRQRLDRSADGGAGDVDRHSARGRRHRADVLGGRRRPAGWRDDGASSRRPSRVGRRRPDSSGCG